MNELESFGLANKLNIGYSSLCGLNVIESQLLDEFTPTLELSNDVPVSDEFRIKENAWLLERFGKKRTMYIMNGCYVTHPNTVTILKNLP